MADTSKVVWKEGMFLHPHHFQQAERFLLNTFETRFRACLPYGYGFSRIELDRDALVNGLIGFTSIAGIFPDGTVFEIPGQGSLPPSRPVADRFATDQQRLTFFLALPRYVLGRENVVTGLSGSARFSGTSETVCDDTAPARKKEIEVGSLNLSLLFEGEKLDDYVVLQAGVLVRNASGQVVVQESYVVPLVSIGASKVVLNGIRGLLEVLFAKISLLSQGRKQIAGGLAEFSDKNTSSLHLLQILNTYTPLLAHMVYTERAHPFDLFTTLTQITGALCTFSTEFTIKSLPRYEHDRFGEVIALFTKQIRSVLSADIAAGCVAYTVQQINPATYEVKIDDEKMLQAARFFLSVSAGVPEKELIVGVLQRVKMCARERLDLLIASAMPGLQLMHTIRPPEGLSTKPGVLYFSIDKSSEFWQSIILSKNIAFYFPNNYANLHMEILALKE